MEHDLRANAFFAFVAREDRYRFSLAEIMLESNGWGGTAFRRKAIPRWKRVLESNPQMGTVRLLRACVVMLAFLAAAVCARPALAQANFDRPGGDYLSSPVISGDPAECALVCERDRRCRAWTFSYPTDLAKGAVCWLKSNVPARVQSDCCVTGVRGAGVVERRNEAIETSIDRFGGDYKSFDLKSGDGDDACKAACAADNKCRAWTYARPGYAGKEAHCFLKKDIKPPRRKAGFTSGVVR
jgi:PAN domain